MFGHQAYPFDPFNYQQGDYANPAAKTGEKSVEATEFHDFYRNFYNSATADRAVINDKLRKLVEATEFHDFYRNFYNSATADRAVINDKLRKSSTSTQKMGVRGHTWHR
jgi:hypothetical protein